MLGRAGLFAYQGRVVSKLSDYSGSFPIDLGNVRLNINNIEFDNVNRGDHPMVELQIVNMGRKSYKPYLMHLPPYLSAQYFPETLSGGRIGKIMLTLDSEKLHQMGLTQTSIYLARKVGDKVSEDNEITVSSVLLPDFFVFVGERQGTGTSHGAFRRHIGHGRTGDASVRSR